MRDAVGEHPHATNSSHNQMTKILIALSTWLPWRSTSTTGSTPQG